MTSSDIMLGQGVGHGRTGWREKKLVDVNQGDPAALGRST
jgi:hypothetical protein